MLVGRLRRRSAIIAIAALFASYLLHLAAAAPASGWGFDELSRIFQHEPPVQEASDVSPSLVHPVPSPYHVQEPQQRNPTHADTWQHLLATGQWHDAPPLPISHQSGSHQPLPRHSLAVDALQHPHESYTWPDSTGLFARPHPSHEESVALDHPAARVAHGWDTLAPPRHPQPAPPSSHFAQLDAGLPEYGHDQDQSWHPAAFSVDRHGWYSLQPGPSYSHQGHAEPEAGAFDELAPLLNQAPRHSVQDAGDQGALRHAPRLPSPESSSEDTTQLSVAASSGTITPERETSILRKGRELLQPVRLVSLVVDERRRYAFVADDALLEWLQEVLEMRRGLLSGKAAEVWSELTIKVRPRSSDEKASLQSARMALMEFKVKRAESSSSSSPGPFTAVTTPLDDFAIGDWRIHGRKRGTNQYGMDMARPGVYTFFAFHLDPDLAVALGEVKVSSAVADRLAAGAQTRPVPQRAPQVAPIDWRLSSKAAMPPQPDLHWLENEGARALDTGRLRRAEANRLKRRPCLIGDDEAREWLQSVYQARRRFVVPEEAGRWRLLRFRVYADDMLGVSGPRIYKNFRANKERQARYATTAGPFGHALQTPLDDFSVAGYQIRIRAPGTASYSTKGALAGVYTVLATPNDDLDRGTYIVIGKIEVEEVPGLPRSVRPGLRVWRPSLPGEEGGEFAGPSASPSHPLPQLAPGPDSGYE
ncbi:uncharacterized protein PFL1_05922 [Pseudozyma flocculosa PF-1]|uniref:PPIase cyclophilin-type domain-containing protein n=2 Tax=Pseudozyma flocculosa TaxID=84751 RepID=A0A5C3F1R1_9BASI|nr:uncharacterized protein PFL1_05922 [Pseudozyma flocculosa PF-1]EPQ26601.1 hypothetical protein PFL1_05922 [Pseudozyma flocculosa PF-1]SPO38404.1 uncharacterized protein PSFLO_03882 [Pseudozyma flocculosa]